MKISGPSPRRLAGSALLSELIIALVVLVVATIPLAYGFFQEWQASRSQYFRAVAMQVVDGEAEILAAGEWRAFAVGQQEYKVTANAASNLPPGRFLLTVDRQRVKLEWTPARRGRGGPVVREFRPHE